MVLTLQLVASLFVGVTVSLLSMSEAGSPHNGGPALLAGVGTFAVLRLIAWMLGRRAKTGGSVQNK